MISRHLNTFARVLNGNTRLPVYVVENVLEEHVMRLFGGDKRLSPSDQRSPCLDLIYSGVYYQLEDPFRSCSESSESFIQLPVDVLYNGTKDDYACRDILRALRSLPVDGSIEVRDTNAAVWQRLRRTLDRQAKISDSLYLALFSFNLKFHTSSTCTFGCN